MPTSVHTLMSDSKTCVVGYTSGSLGQFDFHGEQLLQMLRHSDLDALDRESREAQINQVPSVHSTAHFTWSALPISVSRVG